MKNFYLAVLVVVLSLTVTTGCLKKKAEATVEGSGFEALESSEQISNMPPSSNATNQPSIEALPVEPSPVTPAVVADASAIANVAAALPADLASMSKDKQIQLALKNAGLYSGNIDGKIGPGSKKAIEEFQKTNGLTVDGKVGPKTWAALQQYLGAPKAEASVAKAGAAQ